MLLVCSRASAGRLAWRKAEFMPICGESENWLGVLAIVDSADLPQSADGAPPSSQPADEANRLHLEVARIRREIAAQYHIERIAGNSPSIQRVARRSNLRRPRTDPF